jgi:hypothetical protein
VEDQVPKTSKNLDVRLQKLQKQYEKIRQSMLGQDWETQMELRQLLEAVETEIKKLVPQKVV